MMDIFSMTSKVQQMIGKGRDGEYVLNSGECSDLIVFIYNSAVSDCCGAILETSSSGCHDHVERLIIDAR